MSHAGRMEGAGSTCLASIDQGRNVTGLEPWTWVVSPGAFWSFLLKAEAVVPLVTSLCCAFGTHSWKPSLGRLYYVCCLMILQAVYGP